MTNDPSFGGAVISLEQSPSLSGTGGLGRTIKRHWDVAVVVAVALLVWLPRLSGPIDLRWDAGVYYLLGTSLASGHGYRIPSEPGAPKALQYPPLLPAIIALHERALDSTDPAIVAPWLRKTYAGLFLGYAFAVLALARRHLPTGFAVVATVLVLLYSETIFFSDLLYAELPFALVSVLFALVATGDRLFARPWLWRGSVDACITAGVSAGESRHGGNIPAVGTGPTKHQLRSGVFFRSWSYRAR